jgi:hypothetical protein
MRIFARNPFGKTASRSPSTLRFQGCDISLEIKYDSIGAPQRRRSVSIKAVMYGVGSI